ncbi:MAG: class I SAM-dependent methyltransferase [Geminicoccaceae bacterium]
MNAALRKRPLWARTLDRLHYGFGKKGKARKRAAEALARAAAFESQTIDTDGGLPQRRYASYQAYVDHQASKLTQIERRLRRVENEDLESFRSRFADCAALEGQHTVLCLGARLGTEVRALMELGHLAVGVDLNPGAANQYVLHGDFHHLVFPDRSFSAVYTNTLDHVFDLPRLVDEIRRVLVPDGVLIADVVPGFDEGHLPGDFESTYWTNVDALVDALTAAGMRMVSRRALDREPWQQIILKPASGIADKRRINKAA